MKTLQEQAQELIEEQIEIKEDHITIKVPLLAIIPPHSLSQELKDEILLQAKSIYPSLFKELED